MATVKEIDALLPQTQCGECGYPGCMPYAEALASGVASINLCPPGGVETVKALGALLHIDAVPFLEQAVSDTRKPSVAVIREADCIGCTKCIKACPVDVIIGSAKQMHAIITHDCTGCGLCVAPCPVDCIDMVEIPKPLYDKDRARTRFQTKKTRGLRDEHERQQIYRKKKQLAAQSVDKTLDISAKQDYIQAALARVKMKNDKK
jgi:Na+-translocating ferredoxin:NAD+ oxidoreductase subunit B